MCLALSGDIAVLCEPLADQGAVLVRPIVDRLAREVDRTVAVHGLQGQARLFGRQHALPGDVRGEGLVQGAVLGQSARSRCRLPGDIGLQLGQEGGHVPAALLGQPVLDHIRDLGDRDLLRSPESGQPFLGHGVGVRADTLGQLHRCRIMVVQEHPTDRRFRSSAHGMQQQTHRVSDGVVCFCCPVYVR